MGKKIAILIVLLIIVFLVFHETKTNDFRNSFVHITEKLKEKKPEARTKQKVKYLKEKAQNDIKYSDKNTIKYVLKYIKNNIENPNSVGKMESLIYYGYILQYTPKKSNMGLCTTIGIRTVEAVSEVYIKDDDYKKNRKKINKTKAQIIRALISRVDIK